MTDAIVQFFQSWTNNDYLTLFLVSIIPIIELRGAIILMGGMTGISKIAGMFVCLAGSSVVIFPLLLCLRPILNKLKKTKVFGKIANFFEELFSSKAQGVNDKAEKRKATKKASADTKKFLGLAVFVKIGTCPSPKLSPFASVIIPCLCFCALLQSKKKRLKSYRLPQQRLDC